MLILCVQVIQNEEAAEELRAIVARFSQAGPAR